MPRPNSKEVKTAAEAMMKILWDDQQCELLLKEAVSVIDAVAKSDFDRDTIRTPTFTAQVVAEAKARPFFDDVGREISKNRK